MRLDFPAAVILLTAAVRRPVASRTKLFHEHFLPSIRG